MMNHMRMLINRMPWQRLLALCLILVIVTAISSCRGKSDTIVGSPDTTATGAWVIYLSHDDFSRYHLNDTITVRVYNPDGMLANAVNIQSTSNADPLSVNPSVTTSSDTAAYPWGTHGVALVYWGADTTLLIDTVTSRAFVGGVEVADTFTIINLISDF
jgi:hypothetical protein